MKKILCLILFLASAIISKSQDEGYPISRFALSLNPLGVVQFGPIVNAEAGLTKNLVLNAHVRFAPYGVLSYVVTEWPDKITGFAYGGGLIYFFGEKRNKPYVGVISEYQKNKDIWENSDEIDKVFVFLVNGGYRFRFKSGFFINTGAYLGFGHSNWVWTGSYTEEGSEFQPAGLVEVTFGFEF
jgi:hypothetical protein